jgi:hypothetical protein
MTKDERNKLLIDFYKGNLDKAGIDEIIRIAVGTRDVMKDNNGRIQFSLEGAVELLWKTGRWLDEKEHL